MRRRAYQTWDQARRHAFEASLSRQFNQPAAAALFFRVIGSRRGVEQRQTAHPRRRLPHDFKGHVTAQRQSRESEARRRRRQHMAGDFSDRRALVEARHLHFEMWFQRRALGFPQGVIA